ncbi:hypothetical protein D3C72_1811240 [compost metagenome]
MGASRSSSCCISCAVQVVPLGLCGVLISIKRVLGVMAAAILPKSGRKVLGVSGTRTGTPPASSMLGT